MPHAQSLRRAATMPDSNSVCTPHRSFKAAIRFSIARRLTPASAASCSWLSPRASPSNKPRSSGVRAGAREIPGFPWETAGHRSGAKASAQKGPAGADCAADQEICTADAASPKPEPIASCLRPIAQRVVPRRPSLSTIQRGRRNRPVHSAQFCERYRSICGRNRSTEASHTIMTRR